MTPEETRIARHHLGDTLTTLMRGGPAGKAAAEAAYRRACGFPGR